MKFFKKKSTTLNQGVVLTTDSKFVDLSKVPIS